MNLSFVPMDGRSHDFGTNFLFDLSGKSSGNRATIETSFEDVVTVSETHAVDVTHVCND